MLTSRNDAKKELQVDFCSVSVVNAIVEDPFAKEKRMKEKRIRSEHNRKRREMDFIDNDEEFF